MIGKQVIVRANGAGVFFGTLKEKNGAECTLINTRKLYYWDGACAVEQLAVDGTTKPDNCKFTVWVKEIQIENVLQTIPCTKKSIDSLSSVKIWKQ